MDTIEEVQLRWNSGGIDQRSPSLGSEPAEVAALQSPGELAEEQRLLQEFHLALDRVLGASGPGGTLGGGPVIIQYGGEEVRPSLSKSCRISFFIISHFLCH